jgi:tetratricopeptide (TPR) repeat protein
VPNKRKSIEELDKEYAWEINNSGAGALAMQFFFGGDKGSMLAAVRHYDDFITTHPNNMLARTMRCECRVMNDYQLEDAVAESRMILEAEPHRARAWYCLGRALVRLRSWSEAVEPLEKYRKFFPDDLDTLLMLSLCYGAAELNYDRALRYARRSVRLAPDDVRAHEMVIRCLKAKGEDERALRYSIQLMDYKPQVFNKLLHQSQGAGGEVFEEITDYIM